MQVTRDTKKNHGGRFSGDEPSGANCQFLLEGEDLQGANEGEPKMKISGGTEILDTVKPGREETRPNGTGG